MADMHLECDVTDERAVAAAIERVSAALGPPSVLVNNAGVNAYADPGAMPSEEWDAFFALDLKAAFLCSRAVLGGCAPRGTARSSTSRRSTRCTRARLLPVRGGEGRAARAHAQPRAGSRRGRHPRERRLPGLIGTRLSRESLGRDPEAAERLLAAQPLERMGEPAEVAAVVAFLASADASFVTGATIMRRRRAEREVRRRVASRPVSGCGGARAPPTGASAARSSGGGPGDVAEQQLGARPARSGSSMRRRCSPEKLPSTSSSTSPRRRVNA